jgi:hypothetical protein
VARRCAAEFEHIFASVPALVADETVRADLFTSPGRLLHQELRVCCKPPSSTSLAIISPVSASLRSRAWSGAETGGERVATVRLRR